MPAPLQARERRRVVLGKVVIVVLGLLITFHEFGHFWVARRCGVKVLRFSVGFGKEIAGYTDKRGTRWKLSALPIGGYVQFQGLACCR